MSLLTGYPSGWSNFIDLAKLIYTVMLSKSNQYSISFANFKIKIYLFRSSIYAFMYVISLKHLSFTFINPHFTHKNGARIQKPNPQPLKRLKRHIIIPQTSLRKHPLTQWKKPPFWQVKVWHQFNSIPQKKLIQQLIHFHHEILAHRNRPSCQKTLSYQNTTHPHQKT